MNLGQGEGAKGQTLAKGLNGEGSVNGKGQRGKGKGSDFGKGKVRLGKGSDFDFNTFFKIVVM